MTSAVTKWILEVIDRATSPLRSIDDAADKAHASVSNVVTKTKELSSVDFYAVSQSMQQLHGEFDELIQPGIAFQDNLADVEAITGVTGEALDDLGDKARKSALRFGGDASDSLQTYKKYLSQLSPELAKNADALSAMEIHTRTLSKSMENDLGAATDALSTSMLQYQVDLTDAAYAEKVMGGFGNVMAAGAKEGSAEVTDVSKALKVAGVQAYNSRVNFVELNAAVQELDRGGKKGAEGGTALRNILAKMSGEDILPKKAVAKLEAMGVNMDIVSDKSRPFTERLRELKKASADATVFAQMFGIENEAAAQILVRSIDAQEDLQQKITGTNVAYEQAEVKMATYSEWTSRMKARLSDLGIGFFNATESAIPFIQAGFYGIQTMANWKAITGGFSSLLSTSWITSLFRAKKATTAIAVANSASAVTTAANTTATSALAGAQAMATATSFTLTGAVRALSTAIMSIPVVGWILAGITALIALFTYLWNNVGEFRGHIYGMWNVVKLVFGKIWNFIKPVIEGIGVIIKTVFKGLWEFYKNFWIGVYDITVGVLKGVYDFHLWIFTGLWNTVKSIFNTITQFLQERLNTIYKGFKLIFGGIYLFFKTQFNGIYTTVTKVIDRIVQAIQKAWRWLKGFWGEASKAYDEGMEKGKREVDQKKKKEKQAEDPMNLDLTAQAVDLTKIIPDLKKSPSLNLGGKAAKDKKLEAEGLKGGVKNITQNIEVNNTFGVNSKFNLDTIADAIVGKINDRLRDGLIALD